MIARTVDEGLVADGRGGIEVLHERIDLLLQTVVGQVAGNHQCVEPASRLSSQEGEALLKGYVVMEYGFQQFHHVGAEILGLFACCGYAIANAVHAGGRIDHDVRVAQCRKGEHHIVLVERGSISLGIGSIGVVNWVVVLVGAGCCDSCQHCEHRRCRQCKESFSFHLYSVFSLLIKLAQRYGKCAAAAVHNGKRYDAKWKNRFRLQGSGIVSGRDAHDFLEIATCCGARAVACPIE